MEDTKKIIYNAGPSHTYEGSSLTKSGPCFTQAGPSSYHSGSFSDQAGPSHTQEGFSLTKSGPCSTQAGPSSYHSGLFSDQAGPSYTQEGSSLTRSGPCSTQAGSSFYYSGPSSDQADPSHTQEGSSLIRSGPCSTQAGPSSYHSSLFSDHAGPSHTQFDEFKRPYPPKKRRIRKKGTKCLEEEIKRLQEEEEELMRLEEEEVKMLEVERVIGLDEEEVMRLEDEELMRLDDEEAMSLWEEEGEAARLQERKLDDEPSRVTTEPCPTRSRSRSSSGRPIGASPPLRTQAGPSCSRTTPSLPARGQRVADEKVVKPAALLKAHHKSTNYQPPKLKCSPLVKHPLTKPEALRDLDERRPKNKKHSDTARGGHFDFRADDHFASEDPIELETKKVKCADCKKVFSSKPSLRRHIQTAHEKDHSYFKCDYCGSIFGRRDSLGGHIRSKHSDIQIEDPCSECGVKFTSAYQKNHHTQFTCPSLKECKHCKKFFSSNGNLRRHMNTAHEEGCTVFERAHCEKTFPRSDILQEHVKTVHSRSKPGCYRCPKCGCEFIRKQNLTRHHSLGCHPPLFYCSQCPYKSYFKIVLNKHMLTQHGHRYTQ